MKNFMTNREFKKQRKYYKKQYAEGHLQYFYDTEEYKLFVDEESKRADAKFITNKDFENQKLDPNLRVVAFKYLKKYEALDNARTDFIKMAYANKNLDIKLVAKFLHKIQMFKKFSDVKKELISAYCFDGQIFYNGELKPTEIKQQKQTEFKKAYRDFVLKLRRETCVLSVALNQAKEDIKNINQKEIENQMQKEFALYAQNDKTEQLKQEYKFNTRQR